MNAVSVNHITYFRLSVDVGTAYLFACGTPSARWSIIQVTHSSATYATVVGRIQDKARHSYRLRGGMHTKETFSAFLYAWLQIPRICRISHGNIIATIGIILCADSGWRFKFNISSYIRNVKIGHALLHSIIHGFKEIFYKCWNPIFHKYSLMLR